MVDQDKYKLESEDAMLEEASPQEAMLKEAGLQEAMPEAMPETLSETITEDGDAEDQDLLDQDLLDQNLPDQDLLGQEPESLHTGLSDEELIGSSMPVERTGSAEIQAAKAVKQAGALDKGQDSEAEWYVVHTYSGYENKVKNTLVSIADNLNLHEYIQDVAVPTEKISEIKNGKKRLIERKLYPGYVLVKLVLTDDIWFLIRNTKGVTGFVGPSSTHPIPLTHEEQMIMQLDTDFVPVVDYKVGDHVKVINGPFEGSVGEVIALDEEKNQVRVSVTMLNRETPVDLDFMSVLKVD